MAMFLKKNDEPTTWNKEALAGALVGSYVMPVLGTIVGGIIGGNIGKNRMETEKEIGRRIEEPTFWNLSALNGGLIGALLGGVAALVGAFAGASILGEIGFLGGAVIAGSASMAIGTYIGGTMGEAEMERDYKQALEQTVTQQSTSIQRAQEVLAGNEPEKTNSKSFVATEEARREHQAVHAR
jgi:fumarate reductase subunit D